MICMMSEMFWIWPLLAFFQPNTPTPDDIICKGAVFGNWTYVTHVLTTSIDEDSLFDQSTLHI